ncbi:hypothetical protein FQV37_2402 [Psychrobacter nivimaris]|uniref:Uncharacterized protein n=1 Tax=Psychrobacter nivimaris TaxID=281738 RepID=A0A6N7C4L0_9GAMM|nr:hypothetical protein FQV37_2402 [Psychrobacter nivimaris]
MVTVCKEKLANKCLSRTDSKSYNLIWAIRTIIMNIWHAICISYNKKEIYYIPKDKMR